MILLIDNYDSFSYNLVQLIGTICVERQKNQNVSFNVSLNNVRLNNVSPNSSNAEIIGSEITVNNLAEDREKLDLENTNEIKVIRNDELTVEEIKNLNPSHIILSPGPGRPIDAGVCEEVVHQLKGTVPILGVCLGHQGICEVFGATITYASTLMHGKQSVVTVDNKSNLFADLPEKVSVGRYHSLAAKPDTIPEELEVIGVADDGDIMAVKHKEYEIYGLQFHPESVLTPNGKKMMENFLNVRI